MPESTKGRDKRIFKPMKRLYLVANTPCDKLEEIVLKAIQRIETKTGTRPGYSIEFGRCPPERHSTIKMAKFVIMLNPSTYKSNQDLIPVDAIGFILSDPMTLNCISGKCIERWDFEPTENGLKYTPVRREPQERVLQLFKAYKKPLSKGKVKIEDLRYVPSVLNSIGDGVAAFVQTLSALSYSIRDEVTRHKFKMAFIHWIPTAYTTAHLKAQLMDIGGWSRSARVDAMVEVFDKNPLIRGALKTLYNGVYADKTGVKSKTMPDIGKLAEHARIGVFDLRYILGYMRKNELVNKEVSALRVHLDRCAKRYASENPDEPFTADTDLEMVIDQVLEEQEEAADIAEAEAEEDA